MNFVRRIQAGANPNTGFVIAGVLTFADADDLDVYFQEVNRFYHTMLREGMRVDIEAGENPYSRDVLRGELPSDTDDFVNGFQQRIDMLVYRYWLSHLAQP